MVATRSSATYGKAGGAARGGRGGRSAPPDPAAWAEARSGHLRGVQQAAPGDLTVVATIPLRGRRGTIARRMVSSLQTAAQLTSVLELDVKPLVGLRPRPTDE